MDAKKEIRNRFKTWLKLMDSIQDRMEKLERKISSLEERSVEKYSENEVDQIIAKTLGGIREVNNMQNDSIDRIRKHTGLMTEITGVE